MEEILDLYEEAYDPKHPTLCMDERSCQLINDVLVPIPMKSGKSKKVDYEYERKGTCCVFIVCEPLTGWRYIEVRKRRTKVDYAQFMEKVSGMFPAAEVMRLVQDNLNTHTYGSFYENFDAEKARSLKKLFEFHYTPKHASWLNMAEIDLSALSRQCLDRRMGDVEVLEREVKAWERERNEKKIMIQWRFTTNHAREKLKRHYEAVIN
jgi:hypothetical protein